jgi:ABC-type phosphate transport system substrate-binding protein
MVRQVMRKPAPRRLVALAVLAAAAALASSPTWAAEYTVIANGGAPGAAVSMSDLKAMFLGDKTTWSNGAAVKIVVLEDGAAHKAFLQEVLGKTPAQFDSYWKKLVFTGKAGTPRSFADPAALAAYVAKEPGAIGYVPAGTPAGSAKAMKVE